MSLLLDLDRVSWATATAAAGGMERLLGGLELPSAGLGDRRPDADGRRPEAALMEGLDGRRPDAAPRWGSMAGSLERPSWRGSMADA